MAQMPGLRERARCTQASVDNSGLKEAARDWARGWEDADRDSKRRQDGGRGGDIKSLGRWVGGPEPHARCGLCP